MANRPADLQKFFDSCPDAARAVPVSCMDTVVIKWSQRGKGFGELTLMAMQEGLFIDAETMSRDFVKDVLNRLVDDAYDHQRTDHRSAEARRGQTDSA